MNNHYGHDRELMSQIENSLKYGVDPKKTLGVSKYISKEILNKLQESGVHLYKYPGPLHDHSFDNKNLVKMQTTAVPLHSMAAFANIRMDGTSESNCARLAEAQPMFRKFTDTVANGIASQLISHWEEKKEYSDHEPVLLFGEYGLFDCIDVNMHQEYMTSPMFQEGITQRLSNH